MKSVADACSAVGLDRVGSDWEGVKYHVKAFKKKKLDEALKQPEGRHRTLLKQEDFVPGSSEKFMSKPCPSEDETPTDALDKGYSYDMAVMEVGKLTSRKVNAMSQHGAIKHVFEKTNIKVSRNSAEWSHRNKGLVPPSNRGRKLILGQAGEDIMVKVVSLLIHHRLPRKKHIVLQIANNMADILGLDVGKNEQLSSGWFYGFRDRHKDMFEFSAARGLESVRARPSRLPLRGPCHRQGGACAVAVVDGMDGVNIDMDSR